MTASARVALPTVKNPLLASHGATTHEGIIALVAVVPKDKLTINGPTKSWAGKGSSGHAVHRIFCSECGSPIAHDPDAAPEIIALKAGTLDTEIKKTLKPVCIADPRIETETEMIRIVLGCGANYLFFFPRRTPKSGLRASCPSARSTSLSPSRVCLTKV